MTMNCHILCNDVCESFSQHLHANQNMFDVWLMCGNHLVSAGVNGSITAAMLNQYYITDNMCNIWIKLGLFLLELNLNEKNITSVIRDVDDPAIGQNERSYPLNNDIGLSANNAQNCKTFSDVRQLSHLWNLNYIRNLNLYCYRTYY